MLEKNEEDVRRILENSERAIDAAVQHARSEANSICRKFSCFHRLSVDADR